MNPDFEAGQGMLRLALSCRRFQRNLARGTGMTTNEILCLLVLYSEEPRSIGELSRILDLSLASTSKLLSSLQGKMYISRNLDEVDRRKEIVVLTQLGKGMAERLLALSRELALDVLKNLPDSMRMDFARWIQWYSVENTVGV